MGRLLAKTLFLILSVAFLLYLAIPGPDFPVSPPDSIQSQEKGDNETPLRRAYFTDYTRQEVLDHYSKEFSKTDFGFSLPSVRLNYPPEEAQERIRDQTRSTFLEEVVHPFRESIYVNGFEPKLAKDAIVYEETPFRQKIIIRHHPSSAPARILVASATILFTSLLFGEWSKSLRALNKNA